MPQYDGLYTIIDVGNKHSTIMLDLPNAPNIFLTFHTSEVLPYIESDTELFHLVNMKNCYQLKQKMVQNITLNRF